MGFLLTRKATMTDMDAVMDFYYNMIEEMQGTDFDILWQHDKHPSDAHLRESVERGYMFIGIAEDGNIATALVVNHDRAPGYEAVPWEVDAPLDELGIVHSVATRPAYHGRGYASMLMEFAIDVSRGGGGDCAPCSSTPLSTTCALMGFTTSSASSITVHIRFTTTIWEPSTLTCSSTCCDSGCSVKLPYGTTDKRHNQRAGIETMLR